MNALSPVIARIVLRYLSGLLIGYGLLPKEVGEMIGVDPDLTLLLGVFIGAVVEWLYAIAKRKGWMT